MTEVKFRVTEILDTRKYGSSLEIGSVLVGELDDKRKDVIWWIDPNNQQQWVFYIGITCEIVE